MPATVIAVGQPVNDSERNVIAALRDGLPNGYVVIHNFEIRANRQVYEIDLAVIAPHCVYIVDVKGTRGQIEVYGSKWYPENRAPFHSPLAKLRGHAKAIKSLICDAHPARLELKKVYVHATVILTAPDAKLNDPNYVDRYDVTDLASCVRYFQNKGVVPPNFTSDIRQFHSLILNALNPQMKPKRSPARFGDWEVEEKLGGTDRYTDYRARRVAGSAGSKLRARLRVYTSDPYQETDVRKAERKLIDNAYRALIRMPGHPNILNVREFIEVEEGDRFVLVTEDVAGRSLSQHIRKRELALTFDQKLCVIRGALGALEHAHRSGVIHRNLTPDAILIGADAQPRLIEFDYARSGTTTSTIAGQIAEEFDTPYLAPECYRDPTEASPRSDLYSAGVVFYELLTGQVPFASFDQMLDCDAVFPQSASEIQGDLPKALDDWLQKLCSFKREDRYQSAVEALAELGRALASASEAKEPASEEISQAVQQQPAQFDYNNLNEGAELNRRYIVRTRLGGGGFAVAYKVFDSWGGVERVMKIVLRDRISQFDRFKKEYQTLLRLQEHPHSHVVRLIHGEALPDGTFYILFDYLEGLTVEKCLEDKSLSLEDALQIVKQTADGLAHLHNHGIYHHDIKPSNILWTEQGVKIFDFNVATTTTDAGAAGGGTRRYLPPDFHADDEQITAEQVDRDLYALGLTFYQCVTGRYPFDTPTPLPKQPPRDPRECEPSRDLSPDLAQLMMKMIAPTRAERFASAARLLEGLQGITNLRRLPEPEIAMGDTLPVLKDGWVSDRPNYNPFVTDLLTLYSQSRRSNTGTRGLDRIGAATYVPTLLDKELRTVTLWGQYRLVIISGNAGDGKTAFIQKLEKRAERDGAQIERGANGTRFMFHGRRFYSNYDGSQDEGEKVNDEVLSEFLGPFAGADEAVWPEGETRLIAINEGRLVDFLSEREGQFPRLLELVRDGLRGGDPAAGVAVINLNLRAVVADAGGKNESIFDRLIRRMTDGNFWQACGSCDLRDRCYVQHNYRTLTDPVAGPKVIERLKTLYTITHLRGRLHITLRDLRSALAFTIAGTRDCDEIHRLYAATGKEVRQQILDGFYFNSWLGGSDGSADRLLRLLGEIDVGQVSDPELDRRLDFLEPQGGELSRFGFAERRRYDDELLGKLFRDLKRGYVKENEAAHAMEAHRSYVAMMRRRQYFERRDEQWREMLPYLGAERFMDLVLGGGDLAEERRRLLLAINRGEGITRPEALDHALALRVREVKGGTIRSYRLFNGELFALEQREQAAPRFVEHLPQSLKLVYELGGQRPAELNITLDIYEMLTRLNDGYRPSNEEKQGLYLRLAVFKNTLAAAPYQEVLLTETGHEFYRITREESGVLTMAKVKGESLNAAKE